jgi:hypothetical protein
VDSKESAEVASVARELKQKSVDEAVDTERELGRGRTAARVSQVVDNGAFRLVAHRKVTV